MDSSCLSGAVPCMDWNATDLESTWKAFRQHADFMFSGPLKKTSEPKLCSYLMLWVGEKGRTIFSTWQLNADESKVLKIRRICETKVEYDIQQVQISQQNSGTGRDI